jgi:hypothetical protein
MLTKKCNRCNQNKPTTEFLTNSSRWDKLSTYCKNCDRNCIDPQKEKARRSLKKALSTGLIIKPEICSNPDGTCYGRIEAHHWHGYSDFHALDVIWLCKRHHTLRHFQERCEKRNMSACVPQEGTF